MAAYVGVFEPDAKQIDIPNIRYKFALPNLLAELQDIIDYGLPQGETPYRIASGGENLFIRYEARLVAVFTIDPPLLAMQKEQLRVLALADTEREALFKASLRV